MQTTILELLKTILEIENTDFIQKLADFVKKEKVDFCDELTLLEQSE